MDQVTESLRCQQCGSPLPSPKRVGKWSTSPRRYCCYACYLTHNLTGEKGEEGTRTLLLARLGISAFLAMNVMTFSWALYGEDLPIFFPLESMSRAGIGYLLFALSVPVFLLLGIPYLASAADQFRRLSLGVDSLIAIGTTSAFVLSSYSALKNGSQIYFDTATMVLVLVTLGRYLESTARLRASNLLRQLLDSQALKARVIKSDGDYLVAVTEIHRGDRIKVLPGEKIPLDGRILEGESSVDQSVLTGESSPVSKVKGDSVLAGTMNYDGCVVVEVTAPSDGTVLSQIIRLVEQAQSKKSPVQVTAERLSNIFVPTIITLSVFAFVFWWLRSSAAQGMLVGLSVLLIACPCALGLGVTLASSMGISRAAGAGILVKSFGALERLAKVQTVFFDKTGTLTLGKFKVTKVLMSPLTRLTEDQIVSIAGSLEDRSEHPVGLAIRSLAVDRGLPLYPVVESRIMPGIGVQGKIESPWTGQDTVRIVRGGGEETGGSSVEVTDVVAGATKSYFILDDVIHATFFLEDVLRPSAVEAMQQLSLLNVCTALISGDRDAAVSAIASRVGIRRYFAELLPAAKIQVLARDRSNKGVVGMVGDGVNDAPALASADIGISIRSSTDLAKESSDITIMDSDLRKVPWLVNLSRKTLKTIKWNLFWAFSYNLVGICLAAMGMLRPVHAALAMVASSAFVILSSSRLAVKPMRVSGYDEEGIRSARPLMTATGRNSS